MIVDFSAYDEDIIAFYAQLSPEERTSADRFHFRDDHDAYVLAHGALAVLLEVLLGRRGSCWRIRKERGGRPVLDLPGGKPMHISLSHSRGMAGIAFSRMAPVGIDVEAHRVIADLGPLAEEVLAETEKLALSGSPAPHVCFFNLWVRKEAFLKANGLGITVDLRDVSVADVRALKGALADHMPLTLADISTKPGYSSAVCVLADNQSISVIRCEAQRLLGLH